MVISNEVKQLVWDKLNKEKPIIFGDNEKYESGSVFNLTKLEWFIWLAFKRDWINTFAIPLHESRYSIIMDISTDFRWKQDEFWDGVEVTEEMEQMSDEKLASALYKKLVNYIKGSKPHSGFAYYYVLPIYRDNARAFKKAKNNMNPEIKGTPIFEDGELVGYDTPEPPPTPKFKEMFEPDCDLFKMIDETFVRAEVKAKVKAMCQLFANGMTKEQIWELLNISEKTYERYMKALKENPKWNSFVRENGFKKPSEGNWTNLYLAMTYGTNPLQRLEYYKEFEGVAFAKNEPDRIPDTNVKAELIKKEIPFVEKDYGRYYILTKIGEKE